MAYKIKERTGHMVALIANHKETSWQATSDVVKTHEVTTSR